MMTHKRKIANMKSCDLNWLDKALEELDRRMKDPFWEPITKLHKEVNSEWADELNQGRDENMRAWIISAYDHATPWAKHCFNLLIEYILESDMQDITIDPAQILALLDAGAYMLQCCELVKKSP